MTSKNLSPNFTLEEMIRSTTATKRNIDNTPNKDQIKNLTDLCKKILEPLRKELGYPITINSGFRSSKLNVAVGGVSTSAHCFGLAADIVCPRFGTAKQLAVKVADFLKKNNIAFDQVIYECLGGAQWVHIGIKHRDGRQRKQVLTINSKGTTEGIN